VSRFWSATLNSGKNDLCGLCENGTGEFQKGKNKAFPLEAKQKQKKTKGGT
jgi:hypothetical protein